MFAFASTTISYSFQPVYNPYYAYASAQAPNLYDPGWKVYFVGTDGDNWMKGDDFSDTMWGYDGDDVLSGAGGDDALYGGNDEDVLIGGAGADDLYGGTGIDTVDYSDAAGAININMKHNLSFGGEAAGDRFYSIENVIGTDYNDVIVGTDSILGNTLEGGRGMDIIFGEGGDDVIRGGRNGLLKDGGDQLYGGTGDDVFEWTGYGQSGNSNIDKVMDFGLGDDTLRFAVDDPATASWSAAETEWDGAFGTMVTVTVDDPGGIIDRYDVFLQDTALLDLSPGDIEIF